MNLALLSPWEQLLWLVCAFILIVPIISAGIGAVIRGYFSAKEAHIGKIAKAIGVSLSKATEGTLQKVQEELKKAKERVAEEKKER